MEQPLEFFAAYIVPLLTLVVGMAAGWLWHVKSEAAAGDRHQEIRGVTKQTVEDDGAYTRRIVALHAQQILRVVQEYQSGGRELPDDLAAAREAVERVHHLIADSIITSKPELGQPTLSPNSDFAHDPTLSRRERDQ